MGNRNIDYPVDYQETYYKLSENQRLLTASIIILVKPIDNIEDI